MRHTRPTILNHLLSLQITREQCKTGPGPLFEFHGSITEVSSSFLYTFFALDYISVLNDL